VGVDTMRQLKLFEEPEEKKPEQIYRSPIRDEIVNSIPDSTTYVRSRKPWKMGTRRARLICEFIKEIGMATPLMIAKKFNLTVDTAKVELEFLFEPDRMLIRKVDPPYGW